MLTNAQICWGTDSSAGQCHTNLTLGSQNQLLFQYLLHSDATVFSVSSVQSVTLHLFLTLSGLLQTNSLWLHSQQIAEFQVRHSFWVFLLSPLVSDKAHVRASDIGRTCSNFADHSLQLA